MQTTQATKVWNGKVLYVQEAATHSEQQVTVQNGPLFPVHTAVK